MVSGIYQIVNRHDGKRYIGSAASFQKRFREHQRTLGNGTHRNRYMQRAFYKYGDASFAFQRLLICDKRDLLFYEQRAIDVMKPEYNISLIAGNVLGVKRTAETRAKQSAAKLGRPGRKRSSEECARQAATMIGNTRGLGVKKHSDEFKAALGARRKGYKASPETIAKLSAIRKGMKLTAEQKDKISAGVRRNWEKRKA